MCILGIWRENLWIGLMEWAEVICYKYFLEIYMYFFFKAKCPLAITAYGILYENKDLSLLIVQCNDK